jgi:hypothetical protein
MPSRAPRTPTPPTARPERLRPGPSRLPFSFLFRPRRARSGPTGTRPAADRGTPSPLLPIFPAPTWWRAWVGARVFTRRASRPPIHSVPLRVHAARRARTQSPPPPVTGGDSGSGGRPLAVAVCPAAFSHDDCRQQPQPSTASPADSAMTAFSAEYGSVLRSFRRHHGHLTRRPRPPPPRPGSVRDGRVRPAADGRAGPFRFRKELYRSSRNGTKSRRDVVTREERGSFRSERTGPPVGGRPLSTVPVLSRPVSWSDPAGPCLCLLRTFCTQSPYFRALDAARPAFVRRRSAPVVACAVSPLYRRRQLTEKQS